MKLYPLLIAASLFMTTAASAGCAAAGTTSNAVGNSGKAISKVEVEPDKETLSKGTTLQFQAILRYADGTSEEVTRDANTVWNTSDPGVATVSKTGLVTANKVGLVEISASYKGVKGTERFAVTP